MHGRLLTLALVSAALLAGAASPAPAATVSYPAERGITYRAAAGEANDVKVRLEGTDFVFTDAPGVVIEAGDGCTSDGAEARCTRRDRFFVQQLEVLVGDRPDVVTVDATADAQAGVVVRGEDDADRLVGGGATTFIGGWGDDEFVPGGATRCCREHRVDYDYLSGRGPVTVRLTTVGPSLGNGIAGENDVIHDGIEEIRATPFKDTLAGDEDDNTFSTGGGADVVTMGGGDDVVWGSYDGEEDIDGGTGHDRIWPGAVFGDLRGGEGADEVHFDNYAPSPPLWVSLDGLPNDGVDKNADFEIDKPGNVFPDLEDVEGGDSGDVLVGSAVANLLEGGSGADWIGGAGGTDVLDGQADGDVIDAVDGQRDTVRCGSGHDHAAVDPADVVSGCEVVVSDPAELPERFDPKAIVASGRTAVWLVGEEWYRWTRVVGGAAASDMTITDPGGDAPVTVTDRATEVVPGPGCARGLDDGVVTCAAPQGEPVVDLGGGDDVLVAAVSGRYATRIDMGDGDDRLSAAPAGAGMLNADGGPGDDQLAGGPVFDQLLGGPGDDVLEGNGDWDRLCGGDLTDDNRCAQLLTGDDELDGGAGSDELTGGDGADRLIGGADGDIMSAGAGDDDVDALDGRAERVHCGAGVDHVLADAAEYVEECEIRDGPPPPPPPDDDEDDGGTGDGGTGGDDDGGSGGTGGGDGGTGDGDDGGSGGTGDDGADGDGDEAAGSGEEADDDTGDDQRGDDQSAEQDVGGREVPEPVRDELPAAPPVAAVIAPSLDLPRAATRGSAPATAGVRVLRRSVAPGRRKVVATLACRGARACSGALRIRSGTRVLGIARYRIPAGAARRVAVSTRGRVLPRSWFLSAG